MADDQTSQQTRVILVNGQTIILQGDAGDNSINEINADLLQQALQEVSTTTDDAVEETNDEYNTSIPETEDANDNLVAIFQGDQGETHTIQLTVEQAEALGLHFSVDGDDKPIQHDISEQAAENNMYISDEPNNQLVYPEETKHDGNEVIFDNELGASTPCTDMVQSRNIDDNGQVLQSSEEGMGLLSSTVSTLISEQNQPITLIPQFVDGQMTYTVKIQEDQDEDNILQNRQFTNMDSELKSVPPSVTLQQTNVGVTLNSINSFVNTPVPSVSCSASTNAPISSVQSVPLPVSSVQQSVTLPISSVQQSVPLPISPVQPSVPLSMSSVHQPVTVPISSVQQSVSLNSFQCSRTNVSMDKQTKVSYVILPSSNTSTNSSGTAKLGNTSLGRLSTPFVSSNRNQSLVNTNNLISTALKNATTLPMVLSTTNSSNSTQSVTGTNSTLTGIPVANPNTNVISSTSILSPVATSTSAASGMIRVVAGAVNRSLHPVMNNTSKFSNVLPSTSGRLIGTTGSVTTMPKIVSINPSAVSKVPTTTTPEVSNMVSAALTRMPVPNFNSTKPLGSSENPIQLVQHGQTFHSVQSLTQEQLRQIATVLQQQHLESAPRTKNVVYDAETNTRIIYRVVYPEDLDLRDPRSPDSKSTNLNTSLATSSSRGRGRRGRPPKGNPRSTVGRGVEGNSGRRTGVNAASVDMDFDEDRLILDDSAKGERKKQLARTRSGRLSRPPRHMVKDYKRLHHLDFADADLDDSDGGYSDYQMSEHEAEEPAEKTDSKELLPGLALPKRKISSHFRCPTCQKIYLGYSRMSRHFEMYPDHGNIDQLQMPNRTNNNNNNNDDDRTANSSVPVDSKVGVTVPSTGLNGIVRTGPSRRRGKRRGPWAYTTPEARSQRRKGKLREVLATCEANELAEVAGPAVAGVLSLWDLLLLRVEAVRTEESYVVTLCDELQALLEKVRAVASEILKPLDLKVDSKEHQLELQDELLCTTLGVASGTYLVDDHKLQCMSGGREHPDQPTVKRMRMDTQDDEGENEGTKSGSAVANHDEVEMCSVNSGSTGGRDDGQVTKNKKTDCPEVLSALTLVAKSTLCQDSEQEPSLIPARTSGDDGSKVIVSDVTKSEDFLLSGESNDICVKLASGSDAGTVESTTRLQQSDHPSEFSNSEQHTQDLQTVDDIVNERLKNLTSGSSLVDFSVAAPMNVVSSCMTTSDIPKPSIVSSQDLIDRLGQFRSLRLPNDITSNEVSSFDPEMALAAMGEGEQDSVNASSQHFPSTLQQMESVPSDSGSSFDPEVALAAMGEGEQTSVERQRTQFQQIENVPNGSTFTPEDALVAMGEGDQGTVVEATHGQFQSTLPQMSSIANDPRPPFDPEMALAAMGEGEQVTNSRPTENQFQSALPQMRMDDMSGNSGTPFDPDVTLTAMDEGDRSSVSEMQNQFSSTGSPSSNSGRQYSSAMTLDDIGAGETGKSSQQCTENVTNVSRFDPEMALAAMGEGQSITASESTHIPYQSPITQSNTSSEPGSSFDPEMALAAIGEGESVQTSTSSQRAHADVPIVNSGSFQLQCTPDLGLADTSMDVSLDESGPELDFEALSEEFNRNTRHR